MVRVEDNICTYRYGEILHASAVLLKRLMTDWGYMSTGEDLHFRFRVCPPTKRKKTNEKQVVGGPNSTGEGMNKNKYWREVERDLCLAVLACETISKRKH